MLVAHVILAVEGNSFVDDCTGRPSGIKPLGTEEVPADAPSFCES